MRGQAPQIFFLEPPLGVSTRYVRASFLTGIDGAVMASSWCWVRGQPVTVNSILADISGLWVQSTRSDDVVRCLEDTPDPPRRLTSLNSDPVVAVSRLLCSDAV